MTAQEVISDMRSASGDIVTPYKQGDGLALQWVLDAVTKVLLARPDAYTGYSDSDLDFAIGDIAAPEIGTTLPVNDKFRPSIVGWLIYRSGLHHRNDAMIASGSSQYMEGLAR